MDDYSFGYEYRARIAELQDIAAMDRLAAQVAPASRLRRYAESRGAAGGRVRSNDLVNRVWRRLRRGELRHHRSGATS